MLYLGFKNHKLMPTILRKYGYRFFFYSNEHIPVHIHIEKGNKTAKFNLEYIELIHSRKFKPQEIKEIRKFVEENKELFKNKWYEYFNS